jgi:hypothetical protein
MIVASMTMPAASPIERTFTSVTGTPATKAKKTMSAPEQEMATSLGPLQGMLGGRAAAG